MIYRRILVNPSKFQRGIMRGIWRGQTMRFTNWDRKSLKEKSNWKIYRVNMIPYVRRRVKKRKSKRVYNCNTRGTNLIVTMFNPLTIRTCNHNAIQIGVRVLLGSGNLDKN